MFLFKDGRDTFGQILACHSEDELAGLALDKSHKLVNVVIVLWLPGFAGDQHVNSPLKGYQLHKSNQVLAGFFPDYRMLKSCGRVRPLIAS